MSNVVGNYGWETTAATQSLSYLVGPVVAELRRAGARRVLDLGCGNGAMSHRLQGAGFEVTGSDVDLRGVELARQTASGAKFVRLGVYDPPERLGELDFDAVVSTEVVEHLFEPAALPRFASRVLKPGGQFVVSTPYHGYLKNVVISIAGKWDHHHGSLVDGGHIKFWSFDTLSQLLVGNGFIVERFLGAGRFPFLWKSMIVSARRGSAE